MASGAAGEAQPPAAELVGRKLGPYRVEALLGRGGMGSVYQARDERLGRLVALKTVLPQRSADPSARSRLEREARAAAALAHPNIAVLLDVGEEQGVVYVVYELLAGRSLREELRQRRSFAEEQAIAFALQIADALAAAHAAGIIHRDIKPDNLMLLPSASIKVLDFGLAKHVSAVSASQSLSPTEDHLTAEGALVGTLHYMAPEQLEGRPADARADIYSLGVVLYELVSGRLPYASASPAEHIAQVLGGRALPLRATNPELSAELETAVARCLARAPEARFQTAAELAHALRSLAPGQAPRASAPVEPDFHLGRDLARWLFVAIQLLYLTTYVAAFVWADELRQALGVWLARPPAHATVEATAAVISALALLGMALRLYFVPLVAVDHARAGVQFRRLFPLIFVLDELWALAPLLLSWDLWLRLPCIPPLAFLPFSQRTLMRSAYDLRVGRRYSSSGAARP